MMSQQRIYPKMGNSKKGGRRGRANRCPAQSLGGRCGDAASWIWSPGHPPSSPTAFCHCFSRRLKPVDISAKLQLLR